jgi:nickel-dependent lactate racemase
VDLPSGNVRLIQPAPWTTGGGDPAGIAEAALQNPVAGPRLCELARGCRHLVVITSDHTRPLPSRVTLPLLFAEARRYQPDLEITLLVATGLHRGMAGEEVAERFGPEVVGACHLAMHEATRRDELVDLGLLSTGTRLLVNRLVAEADLVAAEGLIEPHFFAGFSGGRKSILPGVAGEETICRNHRAENIDHPLARNGVLQGNPIHEEAVEAARRAGLRFILNGVVDATGVLVAAVAGEPNPAHRQGVELVRAHAGCTASPAEIVIVSNFGYPLDRNLYQGVKGLSVAAQAAKPNGVLILVAECADGMGHRNFFHLASRSGGPVEILRLIRKGEVSPHDAWQVQILARILERHRAIVVSHCLNPAEVRTMHLEWAPDLQHAVDLALQWKGPAATINVLPAGPATIIT